MAQLAAVRLPQFAPECESTAPQFVCETRVRSGFPSPEARSPHRRVAFYAVNPVCQLKTRRDFARFVNWERFWLRLFRRTSNGKTSICVILGCFSSQYGSRRRLVPGVGCHWRLAHQCELSSRWHRHSCLCLRRVPSATGGWSASACRRTLTHLAFVIRLKCGIEKPEDGRWNDNMYEMHDVSVLPPFSSLRSLFSALLPPFSANSARSALADQPPVALYAVNPFSWDWRRRCAAWISRRLAGRISGAPGGDSCFWRG